MKINTVIKKVLPLFVLLLALATTTYGQSVAIQSEPAIETCYGTPYTATAVVEGATVTKYFWYSGEELLDSTTTNTFTTCNIYVPTRITVKIVTSTNDTIVAQMETINLKDTLIITVTDPALLAQTICFGTAITPIELSIENETDVTLTGAPAGVSYDDETQTIQGTPTESGTFNFSLLVENDCGDSTITGTITVNALPEIPTVTTQQNSNCTGPSRLI